MLVKVALGGTGVLVGVFVNVAVGGAGVLVAVLVKVALGGTAVFVGVFVKVAVGCGVSVDVGGTTVSVGVAVGSVPGGNTGEVRPKLPGAPSVPDWPCPLWSTTSIFPPLSTNCPGLKLYSNSVLPSFAKSPVGAEKLLPEYRAMSEMRIVSMYPRKLS